MIIIFGCFDFTSAYNSDILFFDRRSASMFLSRKAWYGTNRISCSIAYKKDQITKSLVQWSCLARNLDILADGLKLSVCKQKAVSRPTKCPKAKIFTAIVNISFDCIDYEPVSSKKLTGLLNQSVRNVNVTAQKNTLLLTIAKPPSPTTPETSENTLNLNFAKPNAILNGITGFDCIMNLQIFANLRNICTFWFVFLNCTIVSLFVHKIESHRTS